MMLYAKYAGDMATIGQCLRDRSAKTPNFVRPKFVLSMRRPPISTVSSGAVPGLWLSELSPLFYRRCSTLTAKSFV
jgi:hypothetical protein